MDCVLFGFQYIEVMILNCYLIGHKCCNRDLENVLKDMETTLSNEMDKNANASSVQRDMLHFIEVDFFISTDFKA